MEKDQSGGGEEVSQSFRDVGAPGLSVRGKWSDQSFTGSMWRGKVSRESQSLDTRSLGIQEDTVAAGKWENNVPARSA